MSKTEIEEDGMNPANTTDEGGGNETCKESQASPTAKRGQSEYAVRGGSGEKQHPTRIIF